MADHSDTLAFIMAGGRGSRLKVLTRDRCKPAVDILGRYRIFDFVASNVANTGIPAALIATQFKPESLNTYIGSGEIWDFNGTKKLEMVFPCENAEFFGTADSVRKSADRIDRYNPDVVLVLGADHVYVMDYREAIIQHRMSKADITIMTNAVPEEKVSDFGVVKVDESCRIVDFTEKPTDKEVIESFRLPPEIKKCLGIDNPDLNFLASMGNYIFFWDRLKRFLTLPGLDFGKDIIPAIKDNGGNLYAYVFNGYWRDVGGIRDYFYCSMEFTNGKSPIKSLERYVKTLRDRLPSAQVDNGTSIRNTILSSGDVICQGSAVTDSVLGRQVVIEESCTLDHSILLGADSNGFHGDQKEREYATRIGKGSSLSYVILDKNIWIGKDIDIGPHNGAPERRSKTLQNIGLKPYRKLDDDSEVGDFYIEPETGILVIGKQHDSDPKKPILPDGLKC